MKTLLLLCFATCAAAQFPAIYPLEGATPAAVATDRQGNIYVVGQTASTHFPVTANALQSTLKGNANAFIAKFSPAGEFVWSTYFGGSKTDSASGVAIDPAGNVLVAGTTSSPDLPVLNAYQGTLGGSTDAFVLKLDPTGRILYCTYLGGSGNDSASAVAVDSAGAAYISGVTSSPNFPGQTAIAYGAEGFVVKLAASGALVYSWESTGDDTTAAAIAVDASGSAYIAGSFTQAPSNQAFALKLAPDGTRVLYEKHFGGSQVNSASAIAVDSSGAAYIAGTTTSVDFPVANPVQSTLGARPLWKSTDGGNTWTPIDNLPFGVLQQLMADPTAPQTLYAAASDTGVFKSTDGGNTWTAIDSGLANPTAAVLALNPSNTAILYAGSGSQVYRSVNGGANWSLADSLTSNSVVSQIAVDPLQPSNVYAITANTGIPSPVKSTDGGVTWNALPQPASAGIASLLVDPGSEGTVWADTSVTGVCCFGFASWVLRSTDGGATWQTLENISPQAPGLFADPTTKPATIYDGIFARSNNAGSTWTILPSPPGVTQPTAMAIDPRTGTIYAAGYPDGGTPTSFDVSTNQGQSWTQLNVPSQVPAINGITPTQTALYASNDYIQGSAFVLKLSPDGSTILYSTYLRGHGGTQPGESPLSNQGAGIALDPAGNMVVVGSTQALDFPTVNAPQSVIGGLSDAFVAAITADGQRIGYSTYVGGAALDVGNAVAIDAQGDLIVAGSTLSSLIWNTNIPLDTLPTTWPTFSGFVAKIAAPAPVIASVLNAASFQPAIEAGSWVAIQGTNLANSTRPWQSSDFVGDNLPVSLDGVSVTIDGRSAFVEYISPTQINVQAPSDSAAGSVNVVVTNNGLTSAPATAQLQAVAPAFFLSGANSVSASVIPGYTAVTATAPAHPGDLVVLWGTGFGLTNPPFAAGTIVSGAPVTSTVPTVTVGGMQVPVVSSVLSTGTAALYQITIQLPANVPIGAPAVQASFGTASTQSGVTLFVEAQ
jgi:uncharacterized protein (TIGR03437 family)